MLANASCLELRSTPGFFFQMFPLSLKSSNNIKRAWSATARVYKFDYTIYIHNNVYQKKITQERIALTELMNLTSSLEFFCL